MHEPIRPLHPPQRVLLGPGPSDVPPAVLRALAMPTVGHLDPVLLGALEDIRKMLRAVFVTQNALTIATSGTGSSGMEAVLANLIEPGDPVLVGVVGYFGGRIVEIARRHGADVTVVDGEWGRPLDPDAVRHAAAGKRFKLLCLVHAETSTGVRTDLGPFREIAEACGALLCVDTVTSLGTIPVGIDAHGVDAAWSCSQKGLSCPPGAAPITFSKRAVAAIAARRQPPTAWYLDVGLLDQYWGAPHAYHHTASANLLYALHEGLRLVLDEGLDARFDRHRKHAAALRAGLEAMGLELPIAPEHRLDPLTLVKIPDGVDDVALRRRLLDVWGVEIGGALGPFKGKAWRIGLMGAGCTHRNVLVGLSALEGALREVGVKVGSGVTAAEDALLRA